MPQPATAERVCVECQRPFLAQPRDIARGRGLCCSRSCSCTRITRLAHERHPQTGSRNHNWRGGSSQHPSVYVAKFRAANPEKVAAHSAVRYAIYHGVLVRPTTCGTCGITCRPDSHHEDYSKPLSVVWACRKCHAALDKARARRESKRRDHLFSDEAVA